MRPILRTEVTMVETEELQKSVAQDLQVPDPAPKTIVPKKEKKVNENSKEYDRGTGSDDNNEGVESVSK